MRKKNSVLKLLFMMTLTLVSALVIVACTPTNTDKKDVESAKAALEIGFTAPDTKDSVTLDVTLPTSGEKDVVITWQSSHPSVVSTAGKVTRPANDTSVTLTATLKKGEASDTKNFTINVKAVEVTTTPEEALAALEISGDTLQLDGQIYTTTSNITLPTSSLGFTINWQSTSDAITVAGVVTRPAYGEGNERVILTASIGGEERDFIVDVLAIQEKPAEDILAEAQTSLLLTAQATAENINLPTQLIVEGESEEEQYTVAISWESNSEHMNNKGQVDRPMAGEEDAVVTLTATLTYGGQSVDKVFEVVVYAYAEAFTVVANVQAAKDLYQAATTEEKADGVYVRINDLSLVMKVSDGLLFVDSEGDIIFAFGSQSNAYRDAEVGVLYDVVGALDAYFGAFQISATKNNRKPTELLVQEGDALVPNYGEAMPLGDLLPDTQPAPYSDTNLFPYTAARVTAKVLVTSQTDNYGVVLVDPSYTGDGSDLNLTSGTPYENRAAIVYYSSNKDAFLALDGLEVTVDVILYAFRTDRLIHTVLFGGTVNDIEVGEIADEDLLDMATSFVENSIPEIIPTATSLDLVDQYLGATITWTTSNADVIALDGTVTPPEEGQVEVTLKALINAGELSDEVEIKVLVGQLPLSTVEEALLAAANTPLRVEVTVVGYSANNTLIVHDGEHAIAVFIGGNTTTEAANALKGAFGKRVVLEGSKTTYQGLQQIQNVTAVEVLSTAKHPDLTVDITDLDWTAEALLPHQSKLVSITGGVIANKVVDSNGNIIVTVKVGEKTINVRWDSRISITGTNVLEGAEIGDLINVVNAPLGWNQNAPQIGYYVSDQVVVTINPDLETFTVTFMDGETKLGTEDVVEGRNIKAYPATSKEGFAFLGWFTDATFDTPWVDGPITENVTLYASYEELSGTLVVDTYTFSGLDQNTTYVTTPTEFNVDDLSFTRLHANISTVTNYTTRGVVLGLRKGSSEPYNDYQSPYLEVNDKLVGAYKVVFSVVNWTRDAEFRLDYATGIYIQTSTDGETWVNSKNFKDTWNTGDTALNELELILEGDVFVRLFVESAGMQEGTSQLRLSVIKFEVHSYVEMAEPVQVTFDPNYGEEETTVVTLESGQTVDEPAEPTRSGFTFLGWFEPEATEAFDFDTPITTDITLEARWEEIVVTLQTIAEVLASNVGDPVNFIGTISGFTPYSSYGNFDAVFMEDETGSIYIHRSSLPETIAIGDKYEVEGVLDSFNGLMQIAQAGQVYEFISSGNAVSAPTVVTDLSTLVATDQASRISFSAVVKSVNTSGQNLVVTVGEDDITIRSMSSDSENPINALFLTAVVGQTVNVTGIHVGWYNGPQLIPSLVSQFEFVELTDAEKLAQAEADLVLDFDGKEFNMEADIVLPLEGLHGVEVSWAMDPAGAIADGKWFAVTEDTQVTLTATLTLGEETKDVELQVTVKFVDPDAPAEPITVTAAYPNGAGTKNMADGNNAEIVGLNPLLFNVESTQRVNNPLHVGLNNSGQIRLYGSSDTNGNILTISIAAGNQITSVKVTYGGTVGNALIMMGTDEVFNGALTSNSSQTFDELNITEFSIKNINSSTAQIYILSIEITYIPA